MARFLAITLNGLSLGAIYTLLALGFVIIFKATAVISFAHPALMLFGAYWTSYFRIVVGLPFWAAVPLAFLVAGATAALAERLALRRLVGEPVFAAVMVTIGLDVILRVITNDLIGVGVRPMGDPWGLSTFRAGPLFGLQRDVAVVVVSILVVGALLAFFKFSRFGLAMRATALDRETAMAQGVPVGRVFLLSWGLAGGLAALAGTFVGTAGTGIDHGTAFVALKALPVIILGGLDSVAGAIVGGLIIGLAETYTGFYQPVHAPWLGANFNQVVPYVVMLVVLMVKPYGLFGTPEIERV